MKKRTDFRGELIGTLACVLWLTAIPLARAAVLKTRSDGAQLVYATTLNYSAQNPALSPDGTALMFTLYTSGYDGHGKSGGLWKMPVDGGDANVIFNQYGATNVNGLASWNGTVNRIAFADTQDAENLNGDVWIVAPDGSALQRVTNAGAADGAHAYQEPTFSPDGTRIALEDDLEVDPSQSSDGTLGGINIVSLETGAMQKILTDGDNRLPVWSPDGSKILFQRRTNAKTDGGYHLFTISPDGSNLTQITGNGSNTDNCDSDASWSPDGQWILDSACYNGIDEPKIFLVSADGKKIVQVTSEPTEEDGAPAMSPDGRWIYFESHRQRYNDDSPAQIWRIANPAASSLGEGVENIGR